VRFLLNKRLINASARVLAWGNTTIFVDMAKEINRLSNLKLAAFRPPPAL
jgi:hypothetical protein